jgi:ribosomal protein L21E
MATKVSPYELAFLLQSPWVMLSDEANAQGKSVAVELVQEKMSEALRRMVEYQCKMRLLFDRRVSLQYFQPGDLVLRRIKATGKKMDKLDPKWEGPFRIVQGFEGRAFKLETTERDPIPWTWNMKHLRRFYV